MNRGKLVVFEGLDGCGKSTQLRLLADRLRAAGCDPLVTREPTDGPAGRRIREMARSGETVAPQQELAWFVEDRRRHVHEVIEPALAAGRVVLCDRYTWSTVAYQGARGLDWRALLAQSEAEFPLPDLVILLEVDPEQGLARTRARGGVAEPAFEDGERLARVAEIFGAIDRPFVERIDGRGDQAAIADAVAETLSRRLGLP